MPQPPRSPAPLGRPPATRARRGARWLGLLAAALLACRAEPPPPDGQLRVVSLAPSVTRILSALDALPQLVAVDEFSRRVPGCESLPSVGGLFSPDLERTLELRPDLVLAVRTAQQRDYVTRLRARGIRVEEVSGHSLGEVLASFERLGRLVGRAQAGEALAREVRRELAGVADLAAGLRRLPVALVLEREPLYVAGGGSFTQSLIEAAGGTNVFADLSAPYPRVSLEALADRAPEVLIDASVDPAAGEPGVERARDYWSRFAWVKRVEALAPDVATIPGPDLARGARALLVRLHPELAEPERP